MRNFPIEFCAEITTFGKQKRNALSGFDFTCHKALQSVYWNESSFYSTRSNEWMNEMNKEMREWVWSIMRFNNPHDCEHSMLLNEWMSMHRMLERNGTWNKLNFQFVYHWSIVELPFTRRSTPPSVLFMHKFYSFDCMSAY